HVGDQLRERISGDPLGLVALVVAAQVRGDDAEARGEGRDLVAPRVPALREPVQEDHERTVAVDGTVDPDAVGLDEAVLDRHPRLAYRGGMAPVKGATAFDLEAPSVRGSPPGGDTMQLEFVRYEKRDRIAYVTVNRP